MITPKKVMPGILTPENRNSPQVEYGFSRDLIKDDNIEELPERELHIHVEAISETPLNLKQKREEKLRNKRRLKKAQEQEDEQDHQIKTPCQVMNEQFQSQNQFISQTVAPATNDFLIP